MKLASPIMRHLPVSATGEDVNLPENQQVPFSWSYLAVTDRSPGLLLKWQKPIHGKLLELRFTLAIDLRVSKVVEACLGESGYRLGLVDVEYGCPLQTFEIKLPANCGDAICKEGIRLRVMDNAGPLWIFGAADGLTAQQDREPHEGLYPHLVTETEQPVETDSIDLWRRSYESLCSYNSVQLFGWKEGCVLEGLQTLLEHGSPEWKVRAQKTLNEHLGLFFLENGDMRYVDPRSKETVNFWGNNEHGLMVASLAKHLPEHPAIELFMQYIPYWEEQIQNLSRHPSCEACYTIAYPYSMIARNHGEDAVRERLYRLSLQTLLQHQYCLARDGHIYLRYFHDTETCIYPDWLRGVAWYMLGHARVLQNTGIDYNSESRQVAEELRRVCVQIRSLQKENGLWSCFAHQPETGDETSGSAGVAAALVLAHQLGLADFGAVEAAQRCLQGLQSYLSGDGLLHGVSQSNKAEVAEPLQRYGFRCYSQMGQGLAVQLAALLNTVP